MPVDSTHKQYDINNYTWRRCRDVVEGRDALLRRARFGRNENVSGTLYQNYHNNFFDEEYIPRLSNQSQGEYYKYVERADFFNATGRTVDALEGLLFAKPPTQRLPDAIEEYCKDITLDGCSLREFSSRVAREEVSVTRVGVLVDYPTVTDVSLSVADAQRLNLRPYLCMYKAETILNWRCETINGVKKLTLVVLMETAEKAIDEFTNEQCERYRVLDIVDGVYRVRVMEQNGELISESFPTIQGEPMREIPFYIVGGNEVRKPLILDLVHTNIGHYRNSADYENGLHFTGLPTPYVSGVQLSEGQSLQIGSSNAWVFPDPAAKAEYLEFKGDGLKTLADAMKDKEHRMAVLGARMLADEKKSAEAEATVEIRTAGERSVIANVAYDISEAIESALRVMAQWVGVDDSEISYQLNVDFGAHKMKPQMLQALMQAVQGDLMPMSVFFENIKRGELVNHSMDFEEYENEIQTQSPSLADSFELPDTQQNDDQNILGNLRNRLGL